ncbi:MAG TPA: hypothetical protein PLR35_09265 [Burkholderiaceae bacterium]|nr:hypothetical protein [Burkholderiaceae bacterium]
MESIQDGVAQLTALREQAYDNLVQLQRAQLIVRAAEWLLEHDLGNTDTRWQWNPRRPADQDEPDLQGSAGERIIVSAMVAASHLADSALDARLRRSLSKLASLPGKKFLFVDTTSLKRRAVTRILLASWDISVVQIALRDAPAASATRTLTSFPAGASAASAS